jgi:hypothetical protein
VPLYFCSHGYTTEFTAVFTGIAGQWGIKRIPSKFPIFAFIERSYAFIYCLGKGVHFTIMSCKPELVLVRKGRSVLYCMPSGAGGILHHESRDEEVLNHDGLHWGMSQKIRATGFMVGNFEPLLFVSHLSICFVQKAFQRLPASVRICQAEASRKAR